MRRRRAITRAATAAAWGLCAGGASTGFAQYEAPNALYNAPAGYYSAATSTVGATLKAQLNDIIDGHTLRTYNNTTTSYNALRVLDRDPNNANNILLVYSGTSEPWDSLDTSTVDREHLWPNSYGIDSANNAYSDLFNLRPCYSSVNSTRGNKYYDNGGTSAHPSAPDCNQTAGTWEPRAIEKGDIARAMFYMDTRYSNDGDDDFSRDLSLTSSVGTITTGNNNMGNLATLLQWHYQDGASNAERRRNHLIYTSDTGVNGWTGTAYNQGNRNPFVDRPEMVWAIFGGGNNNSKVYAGPSVNTDGSSATTATLRVMQNGTWGSANVVLTKLGANPTTYDITTGGNATTTAAGPGQAFDYNTQQRTIAISLNASTATTGLKTGTIGIDNTDLTSGGAGLGSADGNDTITVNGNVVDNRVITASAVDFGRVVIGSNITSTTNLSSPGADVSNTRVTVKAAASSADSNGVFITAGTDRTYNGTITTGTRTLQANFATTGSKSGSRSFTMQGEGLAGEVVNPLSVSYSATALEHSQPSFAGGSSVTTASIDFGYVPTGFAPRTSDFAIYNNASAAGAALTAAMDVDGSLLFGSGAIVTNVVASNPASPLAADATPWNYTATFTPGAANNDDTSSHTILVSDEDIPGGTARPSLVLTTNGRSVGTNASFPATGFIRMLSGETFISGSFAIGANVTLTKNGPGTIIVNGAQSHGSDASLIVAEGAVHMNTEAGSSEASPLAVNVHGGATMAFNSDQHLRGLDVAGQVSLDEGHRTIVTGSLSHSGGGVVDLGDGSMIVRGGTLGSFNGSAYTGLTGLVDSGRGDGTWNGVGIITSESDADSVLTALAVASADELELAGQTWNGHSVSSGDVVMTYSWGGDAELDGDLDGDDYFWIDSSIGSGGAFGYHSGDFDYDGDVDGDDYFIIDGNVAFAQAAGGPPGAAGAGTLAAVPEPAALGLIAFAVPLLARRRR